MWSPPTPAVPLSANVHPVFSFFCDDGVTVPTERRCDYGDIYRRKSAKRLMRDRLLICSVYDEICRSAKCLKLAAANRYIVYARRVPRRDGVMTLISRRPLAICQQSTATVSTTLSLSYHYVIVIILAQHSGVFKGGASHRAPSLKYRVTR